MKKSGTQQQADALKNMQGATDVLSEMLSHTVTQVRRLQKKQEKALGRGYETSRELAEHYDTKTMKELTAILKDITAVAKALDESNALHTEADSYGVVLLPPVPPVEETEENDGT